jgi:hypothetical protein
MCRYNKAEKVSVKSHAPTFNIEKVDNGNSIRYVKNIIPKLALSSICLKTQTEPFRQTEKPARLYPVIIIGEI